MNESKCRSSVWLASSAGVVYCDEPADHAGEHRGKIATVDSEPKAAVVWQQ